MILVVTIVYIHFKPLTGQKIGATSVFGNAVQVRLTSPFYIC